MRRVLPTIVVLLALGAGPARADDAELVTVTTRGAVATWVTSAPADTTVCWGPEATALKCRTEERSTRFHYAVMTGLRPGTRYVYQLLSAGSLEPPVNANP